MHQSRVKGRVHRPVGEAMMRSIWFRSVMLLLGAMLAWLPGVASAQTIKVGIIGQFSGPFAESGMQFRQGIETYLGMHDGKLGGRAVEVIYRDVGGSNPAVARRLAEELIVRDKVAMLGGFYLSPAASAVAQVIEETATPAVIFNAASRQIVTQSKYFVRTGQSLYQASVPPAQWALKQGRRRAWIAVADYAPGYDVQRYFKESFTAGGGTIVGEDRIALNTVDFSVYAQRIAAAAPDVLEIFIPTGAPSVGFIKALAAQGVLGGKTVVIGSAEVDDTELHLFDRQVEGVYSCLFYLPALDNPANHAFRSALAARFGAAVIPNFAMVGAFDGMAVMARMVEAQTDGGFSGDKAMAAVRGYAWDSPRGPVRIDPQTRDIIQNEYIRRVVAGPGGLGNVVVDSVLIRDPHQ